MKTPQDPEAAETVQTKETPAVAPAATCSRDWWVVDRNADDAKINGPHSSAETAGSVRHVLELNASDEQSERWNLCLKRIPENSKFPLPELGESPQADESAQD